jgi:esterase/lipase superfamily enzyme
MHVEYHKWYSSRLGRDMETLVYGHAGSPVLVFPTSYARFYEWKDFQMIDTLGDKIDAGHLQIFCVDGIWSESWYNGWAHISGKMHRHNLWESYMKEEYYPFIRSKNLNPVIATGTSFGAFIAAVFALKNPWHVRKLVCLSGGFNSKFFLDDDYSDDVYFNSPLDFLPNLHEHHTLEQMRQMDIKLVAGKQDIAVCRETTRDLSSVLWNKGIWNQCDIWDDAAHDWPDWRRMARVYL